MPIDSDGAPVYILSLKHSEACQEVLQMGKIGIISGTIWIEDVSSSKSWGILNEI